MKPSLSIYLSIFLALATIFGCGCGVGFLLGKKDQRSQTPPFVLSDTSREDASNWNHRTLERLIRFLELTDEQKAMAAKEIKTSSDAIQKDRAHTVESYYHHLLELHTRLIPQLNDTQQKKLQKDQKSLQLAIDLRFKSSTKQ